MASTKSPISVERNKAVEMNTAIANVFSFFVLTVDDYGPKFLHADFNETFKMNFKNTEDFESFLMNLAISYSATFGAGNNQINGFGILPIPKFKNWRSIVYSVNLNKKSYFLIWFCKKENCNTLFSLINDNEEILKEKIKTLMDFKNIQTMRRLKSLPSLLNGKGKLLKS